MYSVYDYCNLTATNICKYYKEKSSSGFKNIDKVTILLLIDLLKFNPDYKNEGKLLLTDFIKSKSVVKHNINETNDESKVYFFKHENDTYTLFKFSSYKKSYSNQKNYLMSLLYKIFSSVEYIDEYWTSEKDFYILYKIKEKDSKMIDFSIEDILKLAKNNEIIIQGA